MKYEKRLFIRILVLILITLGYGLFYRIFYPPTILVSFVVLKLFIKNLVINFSEHYLSPGCGKLMFVEACVASTAYYLWSLLVLFTKDLGKKVWKLWIYGVLLIFGMNVLRIIVLVLILYYFGQSWFDLIHLVFWRFVAGIYVALVWIFLVNKFKVKSIPVYSDVKELLKSIKSKKRKNTKRK